jgi:transposase
LHKGQSATHKTKEVKEYLESVEGRFVTHFIPTHSSWLNLVERWFAEITNKRIRRESWNSVSELVKAIKDFIKSWNTSKRSFKWTKKADGILASIQKAKDGVLA